MNNAETKNNKKYLKIETYSMKCRLYPNSKQRKTIDKAIYAVQCYHNSLLYNIYNNDECTVAKPYKPSKRKEIVRKKGETDYEYNQRMESYELESKYKEGDIIHFVDFKKAFSAEYKNKVTNEHPCINNAVAASITTKIGLLRDMQKSFDKMPIEFKKPKYYSKKKPRMSISYQVNLSNIFTKENNNVLYLNLGKRLGTVKIRGWNKNIRFDEQGKIDFIEYARLNNKSKVTITVSRDNCNDYWVVFTLTNAVYKETKCNVTSKIGIDVGVKKLATLSDGTQYEDKKFKEKAQGKSSLYSRKLSKVWGWSNPKFTQAHRIDSSITPSHNYEKLKIRNAKLSRKTARQREHWQNIVTKDIVNKNSFIAIESLDVRGMLDRDRLFDKCGTRKKAAKYSNRLSDSAMSSFLSKLKYKSNWYGRELVAIGQYVPSSKMCSKCNHIMDYMGEEIRDWTCPICGTHHDRDINAAINILHTALQVNNEKVA